MIIALGELACAAIRVLLEMCGFGSFVAEMLSVDEILAGSCFGRFRFGIHLRTGFSVVVVVTFEREYWRPRGALWVIVGYVLGSAVVVVVVVDEVDEDDDGEDEGEGEARVANVEVTLVVLGGVIRLTGVLDTVTRFVGAALDLTGAGLDGFTVTGG